jgi:outer membrane protein OmpA-like peptidoglycan-associated protein
LALEVDALGQVSPISFEVGERNEQHSLQSILRGGGVDVTVRIDELGLPYDPSSGALDRADLYQLITAWRNRARPDDVDAKLYALFTSSLISDNGEPLFGIMFDAAGREGFAVAPRTTERFFGKHEPEPDTIATLQLRTFVHELLHALNRNHSDAVSMGDHRLTLEAPTRCISDTAQSDWSLRERPLMELSPDTIRFFQTAARQDVLPGVGNSPFKHHRVSPTECEEARMRFAAVDHPSLWSSITARVRNLLSMTAASAAQVNEESSDPQVQIRVQTQTAAYPLGYPIAVRVHVKNSGDEALPLVGRLNPAYGILLVETRREDQPQWQVLQPLTWFEPSSDEEAMLAPQAATEETVPIYFGEDGWTFVEPGDYALRVRLKLTEDSEVESPTVHVRVEAPRTDEDRAALQPLLDENGELDRAIGRLLGFGGRIGKPEDLQELERVSERYGHTAIGAALQLTLLSQRLRRPIDPQTGLRPAPDFADARALLDDTCTDSGVAALTSDLLEQRPEGLPDSMRRRIETEAIAWDGRRSSTAASTVPTYSDTRLSAWGPSIHFCWNDAELRGRVRTGVAKLARQLRSMQPARIVLVGHGDASGFCRFNDALALRRAQAVRQALISAGVQGARITPVSLGERRPTDFSANETAYQANRRVEILIEDPERVIDSSNLEQLVPMCEAQPEPLTSANRAVEPRR